MKINICLIQPTGYIHSLALLEAAEYVMYKLRAIGHQSELVKNRLIYDGCNIIFGAHIDAQQAEKYPSGTIIFNTEQLPENSTWTNEAYKKILSENYVWDYSQTNLETIPHQNKALVNFLYEENLRRIPIKEEKEFDLVFYGSINERRKQIIESLMSQGLKIQTIFGLYGPERDVSLNKARAVLNLHFYDAQIFQQIRAFYPLINGIPVISENYLQESAHQIYRECLFTPQDDRFEEFVVNLLKNDENFKQEAGRRLAKYKTYSDDDFEEIAKKTFGSLENGYQKKDMPIFNRMNLGSGKDYRRGFLNIDLRNEVNPDLIVDLSGKINLPLICSSPRFGAVTIRESQFDLIMANDVLEHVPDLEGLMGNCLKILRDGGEFHINVPYDLSLGAWQDPTHIRGFNQNSWKYYTEWFWYLGWFESRFDLKELTYNLSPLGQQLAQEKIDQGRIIDTPRAIDSMKVILVKRPTSMEEKTIMRSYVGSLYPEHTK